VIASLLKIGETIASYGNSNCSWGHGAVTKTVYSDSGAKIFRLPENIAANCGVGRGSAANRSVCPKLATAILESIARNSCKTDVIHCQSRVSTVVEVVIRNPYAY